MRYKTLGGGAGNLKIEICLTIVTETKDDWCKEQKSIKKSLDTTKEVIKFMRREKT